MNLLKVSQPSLVHAFKQAMGCLKNFVRYNFVYSYIHIYMYMCRKMLSSDMYITIICVGL